MINGVRASWQDRALNERYAIAAQRARDLRVEILPGADVGG